MKNNPPTKLREGAKCKVIGGAHEGKSGTVRDIKTGKTGHVSITVVQANGGRFKTLVKNIAIQNKVSMKIFFVILAVVVFQHFALAGIEADIPATNQVVLKSGDWTPNSEQTRKALLSIQSFLNDSVSTNAWKNPEIKKILVNTKKYRVQFAGVLRDGKKVIWCNFFPASGNGSDEFNYWRKEKIEVIDGGYAFWHIFYDPAKDKCLKFASNGYA